MSHGSRYSADEEYESGSPDVPRESPSSSPDSPYFSHQRGTVHPSYTSRTPQPPSPVYRGFSRNAPASRGHHAAGATHTADPSSARRHLSTRERPPPGPPPTPSSLHRARPSPPSTPISVSSYHQYPSSAEFSHRSQSQFSYRPPTPQSGGGITSSDSPPHTRARSHSVTSPSDVHGSVSFFSAQEPDLLPAMCPNCKRTFTPDRYQNGKVMKWCINCREQKKDQRKRRHEKAKAMHPGKKVCISCSAAYSPHEKHSCREHYKEKARVKASSLAVYGPPTTSSGSLSTPISPSSYHGSFRVNDSSSQFSPRSPDFAGAASSLESFPYARRREEPRMSAEADREEPSIREEFHHFIQDVETLLAEPDERLSAPEIRESLQRIVAPYRSRSPPMPGGAASRMMSPPRFSPNMRRASPGPHSRLLAEARPPSRQGPSSRNTGVPGPRFHRSASGDPPDIGSFMLPESLSGRSVRNELHPDVGSGPPTRSGMTRLRNWLRNLLRTGNGSRPSTPAAISAAGLGNDMDRAGEHSRNLDLLASVAEVERRSGPNESRRVVWEDEGDGMSRSQREYRRAGKRRHDMADIRVDSDRREHPPKRK